MFKEKIIIEMKEVFKEIPFGIEHTLKVLKKNWSKFKKIKIITKHEVPGASQVVEKYSKNFIIMPIHLI